MERGLLPMQATTINHSRTMSSSASFPVQRSPPQSSHAVSISPAGASSSALSSAFGPLVTYPHTHPSPVNSGGQIQSTPSSAGSKGSAFGGSSSGGANANAAPQTTQSQNHSQHPAVTNLSTQPQLIQPGPPIVPQPIFEFTKRKRWADLLVTQLTEAIVLVLSPSAEVLYCGNAVWGLLGWQDHELVDKSFLDFMNRKWNLFFL